MDDKVKSLQDLITSELFESDKVGGELDSVIAVLERHGFPLDMKQIRAIAYAKILCPESDTIRAIEMALDSGRFKAVDPGLFLEALDKYTLANRVTGRIPLSKAFNNGGAEK